ncbi:hypothetical protein EsH8_XI_000006 [Colletotrichum jinshuiense]
MLPIQLLGIYRQYKQDTDSVALWLALAAKACGYPNLSQARGDGKAKEGPRPADKKTTRHVIAIKDFLALAEFIASRQDPAVSVPPVFFTTIDRLIRLRSGFGGRLSDNELDLDPESAERHGYFVSILMAVREALRPRTAFATASTTETEAAADAGDTAPKDSSKDLSNRFAALSVDEPSQAFLEAFRNAPHERPAPRDEDPASYEAEPQTSIEDVLFAFTVLVNDLDRTRARIEGIWSGVSDGTFDLAAAAVATNTAISVARGMIEEVAPLLDAQDGGVSGVLNKFYLMICLQKGYTVEQVYLADSGDNFNYDTYPVEDEFLREMRRFDKAPIVSFSLIFTAQIFLDIHHTMRAATRRSFGEMVQEATVMANSLGRHLEFQEHLKINHWPASNDHALRELRRRIQWMGKDPVHGAKAREYTQMGRPVPSEMEPYRILIYSPILSGLFLLRLRTEMYDVGLAVANAWGSITYTAHLYNALRRSRLLDGPWPDMEVLLFMLGDSSIWVGGIKDGAPVSSMFKTEVCSKADIEWTPELLDDIVARSAYQQEGLVDNGDLIMTQIDDPQDLRARNRLRQQNANAEASRKDRAAGGLAPEELVTTLVMALNCESYEMAFPYLVMHRWCWSLLRSVKDACDPVLRELYTAAYMEKETAIYYDKADQQKAPTSTAWDVPDPGTCVNDDLSITKAVLKLKLADVPTLGGEDFRGDYNNPTLLQANRGNLTFDADWNVNDFANNGSIRVVITNDSPAAHPMHLHGFNMYVLSEGPGLTWTVIRTAKGREVLLSTTCRK